MPDNRERLGRALERAFALPESGSFAELLQALEQVEFEDREDVPPMKWS